MEAAFGGVPPDPTPEDTERVIGSIFAYVRETRDRLGTFILANHPGDAAAAQATRTQMLSALEARLGLWSEAAPS